MRVGKAVGGVEPTRVCEMRFAAGVAGLVGFITLSAKRVAQRCAGGRAVVSHARAPRGGVWRAMARGLQGKVRGGAHGCSCVVLWGRCRGAGGLGLRACVGPASAAGVAGLAGWSRAGAMVGGGSYVK